MEKMISYIFGNIENHEKSIRLIAKCLKNQDRINNATTAFAVMTTAYLYLANKEIKRLSKEVEELKKTKGE